MAKISAHGAREVDRIMAAHGSTYVLTSDDRILYKSGVEHDGFKLVMHGSTARSWFASLRRTVAKAATAAALLEEQHPALVEPAS